MTETPQKIDDGGPVHPQVMQQFDAESYLTPEYHPGMSARMWLAGMATDADVYAFRGNTNELTAESVRIGGRFRYADAMLTASRKDTQQ